MGWQDPQPQQAQPTITQTRNQLGEIIVIGK